MQYYAFSLTDEEQWKTFGSTWSLQFPACRLDCRLMWAGVRSVYKGKNSSPSQLLERAAMSSSLPWLNVFLGATSELPESTQVWTSVHIDRVHTSLQLPEFGGSQHDRGSRVSNGTIFLQLLIRPPPTRSSPSSSQGSRGIFYLRPCPHLGLCAPSPAGTAGK